MDFRGCFAYFLLFFLSFCFLTTSTTTTLARPDTDTVVVNIRNHLPNNTVALLALSCGEDSTYHLKVGDHYNRTFQVDQSLECNAMWLQWFHTWDGYEDKRDKSHHTVYWSVEKDGFYHSWDGSNWKWLEFWDTD